MRYDVRIVSDRAEIAAAPKLAVSDYRWLRGYEPEVTAAVVYVEGEGFLIRMECAEREPKAVYTQPDDPVCRDSCMECFINFAPEKSKNYVNLEANALGTLHCKFGPGRGGRKPLKDMGIPMPELTARRTEERWSLEFFFPLGSIRALYGKNGFSAGDRLLANFYKCGDETAEPHFGMWSGVDTPEPDFHRSEFFGELIIRERKEI